MGNLFFDEPRVKRARVKLFNKDQQLYVIVDACGSTHRNACRLDSPFAVGVYAQRYVILAEQGNAATYWVCFDGKGWKLQMATASQFREATSEEKEKFLNG